VEIKEDRAKKKKKEMATADKPKGCWSHELPNDHCEDSYVAAKAGIRPSKDIAPVVQRAQTYLHESSFFNIK
jgi:hypothetical protein